MDFIAPNFILLKQAKKKLNRRVVQFVRALLIPRDHCVTFQVRETFLSVTV